MNKEEFKKSLSHFASGVTAITYKLPKEQGFGGITVSSFASVSLEPAMVLFNISQDANSMLAFFENSRFVINILSTEQKDISNALASPNTDRNQFIKKSDPIMLDESPAMKNSLCILYCSTGQIIKAGDHNIILANVLDTKTDETKNPLVYYDRDYRQIQK